MIMDQNEPADVDLARAIFVSLSATNAAYANGLLGQSETVEPAIQKPLVLTAIREYEYRDGNLDPVGLNLRAASGLG